MELILTKQCESLTGSLGRGFGYYIRSTKTGHFFSQRSKHNVPPEGHWAFIVACAIIANAKFHIEDIIVSGKEVEEAITEAGRWCPHYNPEHTFHAADILRIKKSLGL